MNNEKISTIGNGELSDMILGVGLMRKIAINWEVTVWKSQAGESEEEGKSLFFNAIPI